MASILTRTGPRGVAYAVRYRDPSGKVRSKTFPRKRDAERFANVVEADKLRGGWVDPAAGRLMFATYAAEWIETRPLRPRSVELYRSQLRVHLAPAFGDRQLGDIAPADVRRWHSALTAADRPGPTTVAKLYRLLRAILNTAVEDELILRNPCTIRGAGVERSAERPIATPEQVWALADAIEPRFRAMVLSAAFLGLRFGELGGLTRRHVNLLHRTVTVDRVLVQHGDGTTSIGPPKTDAGRRTIAVPSPLVPELEDHLAAYSAPGPDGLVFCGAKGAHLTRGNWNLKWAEARDAVEDLPPGFRFHDLRHTSNTVAATTGASTRELMARMGHASPAAALRYQHATKERDAVIAEALGDILGSGRARDAREKVVGE